MNCPCCSSEIFGSVELCPECGFAYGQYMKEQNEDVKAILLATSKEAYAKNKEQGVGYSGKSHTIGSPLGVSSYNRLEQARDRKRQLSGWAFTLAAGALAMFLVEQWTASNINIPVINSIGCALAVMAVCKAVHEECSEIGIFALIVLFLFVGQAFMARNTMDKALENIRTMRY